jgi:cytoskeletal protein CcmA (bactofilin family)
MTPEPVPARPAEPVADVAPRIDQTLRASPRVGAESIIAAELTIEGKIDGAGQVRLAGRFKGDVNIKGDLTIEHGAKLTGSVRADSVIVAGEIDGNVEGASHLELLATGVINGDVNVGTMVVASGARMRGRAEFGWGEEQALRPVLAKGTAGSS